MYGIPDRWPHVAAALRRGGFAEGHRVEIVLAAAVADLPRGGPPPLPDLTMRTALGGRALRSTAVLAGEVVGFHEVQTDLTVGGTFSRLTGWAEVWERSVQPDLRRRGIGTWLAGHAADRLRLARAERLLDCVGIGDGDDDSELPFLRGLGFVELTRTTRGWRSEP